MGFIDYIQHINTWWWGKTITLVHKDGIATVEVQIDDNYPATAFIKGLSVFTLQRKKGYGTEMLQLCEDVAKKEGKLFLRLSANIQEEWLVNWYKSLGYVIYCSDEYEYTMIKVIN